MNDSMEEITENCLTAARLYIKEAKRQPMSEWQSEDLQFFEAYLHLIEARLELLKEVGHG